TRASLGAAAAALAFGVLFINVRLALRGLGPRRVVLSTREGPVAIAFDPHQVRAVATVVVALVALLLGWYASSYWLTWLMFQNGKPFGESDPVLGGDVGVY